MSGGKPLTIAEYAKLRGCSRQAVEKAIQGGRIAAAVIDPKAYPVKLDPYLADRAWGRNTRKSGDGDDDGEVFGDKLNDTADFITQRTRKLAAEAELAEIKVHQARGELVAWADLNGLWFDLVREERDRVLAVVEGMAPRLTPELLEDLETRIHDALKLPAAPPLPLAKVKAA